MQMDTDEARDQFPAETMGSDITPMIEFSNNSEAMMGRFNKLTNFICLLTCYIFHTKYSSSFFSF